MNENYKIIKKFQTSEGKEVLLIRGLINDLIEQLLYHSKTDEIIRKNSSDAKRFANIDSFNKWLKKDRSIYMITDKNKEKLLGFYWFGFRPLSEENLEKNKENEKLNSKNFNITIAYRLYKGLRGKRMFTKTFLEAIKDFINTKTYKDKKSEGKGNFWLETNFDNKNSIMGIQKLGFEIIGKNYKNNRAMLIGKEEEVLKKQC